MAFSFTYIAFGLCVAGDISNLNHSVDYLFIASNEIFSDVQRVEPLRLKLKECLDCSHAFVETES